MGIFSRVLRDDDGTLVCNMCLEHYATLRETDGKDGTSMAEDAIKRMRSVGCNHVEVKGSKEMASKASDGEDKFTEDGAPSAEVTQIETE